MSIYKSFLRVLSRGVCFSPLVAIVIISELSLVVEAGVKKGYMPPPNKEDRAQRTRGAGSRGCREGKPVSLNLITPNDHTATTVSGRPTFLWYVSAPVTMRFTLVEPGVSKAILNTRLQAKKSGIVQLGIQSKVPELKEGKEYRWTVSIICNEKRPSENIYARAWIERVPKTLNLVQKLKAVTEASERAADYAQAGVWYDAVSTAYKASQNKPRDPQSSEYFHELLEQVGLSQVVTQPQKQFFVGIK